MTDYLITVLPARYRRSQLLYNLYVTISKYPRIALLILFWIASACILAGAIFFDRGYPSRDSGAFLYIAQSILDGKIPYREAWDNKPPAVFYIDALGLLLGGGTILGVWFLELLSLCISVLLCVKILDRAFGLNSAFFGSVTLLAGVMLLFTVGGTNIQEEYSIPLKFAALWLFLCCENDGYYSRKGFFLGVTGALALLLRQNLIGVHVGIAVYLLITRGYHCQVRRLLSELFWIAFGGSIVIAIVAIYFIQQSAFDDLLDAAFLYNMHYIAVPIQSQFDSSIAGFNELARSGIGIIAVASWLAGLAFLMTSQQLCREAKRLLSLAIVTFPIEVLLAGLSGRGYGHYYHAWLPVIAMLAGFFAYSVLVGETDQVRRKFNIRTATWQLALAFGMAMMPAYATIAGALPLGRPATAVAHTAGYVREYTQPDDYVLVWGFEPSINFVSQRRSPTKFIHQYPLLTRGYVTSEMLNEFINEIEANPPSLIIDTSPVNTLVPPIDDNRREWWKQWGPTSFYAPPPEMDEVFTYLNSNYKERGPLVQPQGAVYVYERR